MAEARRIGIEGRSATEAELKGAIRGTGKGRL